MKQTVLLLKEHFLKNPLFQKIEAERSDQPTVKAVEDTSDYSVSTAYPLVEYSYLLGLLNSQLTEAKGILENIKRWDIPLSRNFDIVELSLRR